MPATRHIPTKKLVILASLSAIGFIAMMLIKIPMFIFLKYEPKDIFITLAGFLYGPFSAMAVAAVTALLELPISETGFIGMIMNYLSSASFACVAAWIYHKRRGISGAMFGLFVGIIATTTMMLLWNYLISPLYMGVSRAEIIPMLTSVFLPFNLIKSCINASLTMLLYRPFEQVMMQSGFISKRKDAVPKTSLIVVMLLSLLVFIGCCFIVISINHK